MRRILGTRVSELEKKLKTLEMTGFWNATGILTSLTGEICETMTQLNLSMLFQIVVGNGPKPKQTKNRRGVSSRQGLVRKVRAAVGKFPSTLHDKKCPAF